MLSETKTCQNCKNSFVIEPEDFDFYEKIKVPPPTWCPDCRAKRRFIFWNMRNLYRKKDARTGKEIFSTYPQEAAIPIYDHDFWWSDGWDPMSYGRPIDFSRPFLAQLKELNEKVPWPSRSIRGMVNSDYSNQASYFKNCYLCFNGNTSENCLYCVAFSEIRECIDIYAAIDIELCYEVYQCGSSFQCFFSSNIVRCRNVWFSRDCVDCSDCFGCANLRHKQYCFFDEQLTKEEYERRIRETWTGSYANCVEIKRRVESLWRRFPHKYFHGLQNVNVSGDYIYNSKNAHNVYEIGQSEDVRYSENLADGTKDSYDYTNWGQNVELMYESVSCGDNCRNVKFCFDSWPAMQDSEYCLNCHSSSDLFGCIGLNKKKYCILNVEYPKEEYKTLVARIKKHMMDMPYRDVQGREYLYGEMLPPEFSPLAYNETIAQEYYPSTRQETAKLGFLWRDHELAPRTTTIDATDLPDHIADATEAILQEIIRCTQCGRAYRILAQELAFYRRFLLPLPRLCVDCRYTARLSIRNPRRLHSRACQCAGKRSRNGAYTNLARHQHGDGPCSNTFETSYAPDRPEIVYCESCYNSEVA